jgi:hypothetical protein
MNAKTVVAALLILGLALSALDVWSDPYYHKYSVNFWVWARREIIELVEGEKDV